MYESLQRAVAEMPLGLAISILRGFDTEPMIAGAFVHEGGACPLLIGRRNGSRTGESYLALARAWDVYCDARRPRRATDRERLVLKSLLLERVYGVERSANRPDCPACARSLHLDHFGACASCGHVEPVGRREPTGRPPQVRPSTFGDALDMVEVESSHAA